jgi:large subunit ribosomal protein L25
MSMFEMTRREGAKAKHLRKSGMIPVGLVEKNHETVPLQISRQQFKEAVQSGARTHVDIHIAGENESRQALLKHIDMDPISREIMSITLMAVSGDDLVKMDVPITTYGENEDAKAGGVTLTVVTDHLKLRGRVDVMPEMLQVDVSNVPAGGTIHAAEIELPEGVELLTSSDVIVISNTIDKAPELPTEEEAEEAAGGEGEEQSAETGSDAI